MKMFKRAYRERNEKEKKRFSNIYHETSVGGLNGEPFFVLHMHKHINIYLRKHNDGWTAIQHSLLYTLPANVYFLIYYCGKQTKTDAK